MRRLSPIASLIVLVAAAAGSPAAGIDFNRDIRPILSAKCVFCHGPDEHERKADLRLDTRDGAVADLGGYSAVVPGDPAKSEVMARILHEDSDELMPPPDSGKALEAGEIALLREWIAAGAEYSEPWAYVPPKEHPVPPVNDHAWPLGDIDRFVLARIEAADLRPAADADPVTLARRLSFDLTGLPPDPGEVAAFAGAIRAGDYAAYERMIDRLLASDAFGERLAIYWLDLVRFADTVGYHGDQDHNISPYRDYVIDAFNDNKPFDEFTREQLAGDLLPFRSVDQFIATGYNRLLQTSHEGGVQPKEYLAIYAADRVRNVSQVWMGATLGCAQCHSHKFDPYSLKDFYAMEAFFADVDEAQHFKVGTNALPTKRPPEIAVLSKRERHELMRLDSALLCESDPARRADLEKEREALAGAARLTMVTVALNDPRPTRVLPRGNWLDDSGAVVAPAIPEFLGELNTGGRATRLDLAEWLTDPARGGGLTARVMANRFWYLMFGTGIARVLDDFGGQGEPPSNPELLDHLARRFLASGWDVKAMLKEIAMSRAYRQSSVCSAELRERDPYNQLFARQGRHRLPAEMVRDAALAISGLLNRAYGGPSAKPYQPDGYYRHLNFPPREYQADADAQQWRRGVYVHWQRQFLHPMLRAFDAPTREECSAQRPRSNTPIAALALLNDPTFAEAARAFAARILSEGGADDRSRLRFAFAQATARQPDAEELRILGDLLGKARAEFAGHAEEAEAAATVGISPPGQGDPAEVAAWAQVARAILNLSETITRG